MAILVFMVFFFPFILIGAFVTETVIPKMTRKDCNSSDKGLWIR